MEMWLKVTTLFLTAISLAGTMEISERVSLTLNGQDGKVNVLFGSSPTLRCTIVTKEKFDSLRACIYFNHNVSSLNGSHLIQCKRFVNVSTKQGRKSEGPDTEKTVFNHTLDNVTEEHAGWYICKVTADIPVLWINRSDGVKLIIKEAPADPFRHLWLWIALGVSFVILVVLLVLCVSMKRRCSTSPEDDPIYANTRSKLEKPSPRPGTEKGHLKTVSSSQNLRNPSPTRSYDEGKRRYRP